MGHDFLGRSSGKGSFSIRTRNLKGINFTDTFPGTEQRIDVYKAANDYNVAVVGGAYPTVGAVGGRRTAIQGRQTGDFDCYS
ncbi:hypothetical protein OPQ81_000493 [Rhizoctonia solani]|nr:hypothetical protein OPQ81_000493 [Rhizoctonia solani]